MKYLASCALLLAALAAPASANRTYVGSLVDPASLVDDDVERHRNNTSYFDGLEVREMRFSENGFDWHLLRFANKFKHDGPLWMVPHDDENAAFEAAIAAVKERGGVAIMVNSGPGSARQQAGNGTCGIKPERTTSCDPNRNFAASSPKFTAAFLDRLAAGQPVIALHTNTPGFTGDRHGGSGQITMLDMRAYQRGQTRPRSGGHFAVNPKPEMANYDTLGLSAYLARDGRPSRAAISCRTAMTAAGTHFWHERVERSDGSMSNYVALNRPDIAYFNAESRAEVDLAISAARHKIMIEAYLKNCNKPTSKP